MAVKHILWVGLSLFSTNLLSAQPDDLFSLNVEALLDVQVDIASKTTETLASVPSTITVFNQQQIESIGIDNAYELMNFVPGMQSTRGDWVGAVPKDHARGIYLDSGNVLVMINGERLNESSFGKASVYMPYIPISVIEKVEFIRGPGSALYGSNAFLGVMNIVTKQQKNSAQFGTGNNGQKSASVSLSSNFEGISGFLSLAYDEKQGETYPQGVKDPLSSLYFEAGLDLYKLQLRTRYNETKLNDFLNLGGYSNKNQHTSNNRFFGAKYTWFDRKNTKVQTSLSYSEHAIKSAGLVDSINNFFIGPAWQTTDTKFVTELSHQFNNQWQVVTGVEYADAEQVKSGVRTNYYDFETNQILVAPPYYQQGIITVDDYPPFAALQQSFQTLSGYGQVKYLYSDELTLFIGGRYDQVKRIDSKFSPRLAGVYQYNDSNTLKIQYGESFRTPVTNELYSNDDVTLGNPNLKSEYVKTTELVWHYQQPNWQLNTLYFYNQLNDFINVVPHPSKTAKFTFANSHNSQNSGVELSSRWQATPTFNLTTTYTKYFDEPINASFKQFASVIADYKLSEQWQVNVNAIWRDEVKAQLINDTYFKQSAYILFGGSLKWQLNKNSALQLKAENMFAKDYVVFDPRIDNGAVAGASKEFSVHYLYHF